MLLIEIRSQADPLMVQIWHTFLQLQSPLEQATDKLISCQNIKVRSRAFAYAEDTNSLNSLTFIRDDSD